MAVKNASNFEITLKREFISLQSNNWDIDRLHTRAIYETFIISDHLILDDYRDYFEQYLEEIDFDPKYHYTPTLFSDEYYGTPDLDFLIMYFAKKNTVFEFFGDKIKILPIDRLQDLNRLMVHYKSDIEENKLNPTVYEPYDDIKPSNKGYIYPSVNDSPYLYRYKDGTIGNTSNDLDTLINFANSKDYKLDTLKDMTERTDKITRNEEPPLKQRTSI